MKESIDFAMVAGCLLVALSVFTALIAHASAARREGIEKFLVTIGLLLIYVGLILWLATAP